MKRGIILLLLCLNSLLVLGNDIVYEERQEDYINVALANNSGNIAILKAYRGIPMTPAEIQEELSDVPTSYTADFKIVELVRILYYSDGLYDNEILPVLSEIPMWLNEGDTTRNYWTENHMIMWMSTEWLMHERYDWDVEPELYNRLIHYLELKRDYGFYEFFSSVYAPYTLSGLLNLYEFSEDPTLKSLAEEVAQRLLKDILKPTTDQGVFFPAAGRNYPGKYSGAYGQNHNHLIYLLTGMGGSLTGASHSGAFLATSELPVDDVILSWSPQLDTTMEVGHPFDSLFTIHNDLDPIDKLIFQWSAGGYSHPDIIQETSTTLTAYGLWEHKDWSILEPLSPISPETLPSLSSSLGIISSSSILTGHNVRLFKNNGVSMMSVPDLWKGKVGFQEWPFAAAVGTTAVYTQAGEIKENWNDRDRNIANTHLPHVEQNGNLALIMYRPEPIPALLDAFAGELFENRDVALFWEEDEYDETVENGNWLMGRQDDNYIAVRRSCTEMVNTWWGCETNGGQTWVVMVGDMSMYGSFDNFQTLITQSEFTESWYYDDDNSQSVYHSQITIDDLSVEYAWGVDSMTTSIYTEIDTKSNFGIYPNPSDEYITLDLSTFAAQDINIRVFDAFGKEVHNVQINHTPDSPKTIQTLGWPIGMYTIIIESEEGKYFQKMIKH